MMERLTVKWTDKVYDTLDPVDILDNEYSKTNYNKLLTKLGEYEDFEEIFRAKMTDTACEFLKDKEEFGKWLDRNKWITKKCDEWVRAEEQGLLLRLPVKAGDTVYRYVEEKGCVLEYTVWNISMSAYESGGIDIVIEGCAESEDEVEDEFSLSLIDFKNEFFNTREEAEAEKKLKEMESD